MQEEISFGIWLRKQRQALDLSRQAFANQVGCAEVTLRRIEAGTLKPSKELAGVLLQRLGIPKSDWEPWLSFARGTSSLPNEKAAPHINRPVTNLPVALTSFIGRGKEQADVIRLLGKYRLITLTGSGGVGKTRLSLKVGEQLLGRYRDGVWLVEFAAILDPTLVPRTTAIAIGLTDESNRPVIDMLCDYLQKKAVLIVLDNCEHLVEACALLADGILRATTNVHILASSRELLGVEGEVTYRVPSLEVPDLQHLSSVESLIQHEAVRLFIDRALTSMPSFEVVNDKAQVLVQICSRLDGIPLAIELAAAKVRVLSVEQIAERLDHAFELLTGGTRMGLERYQTLRAAIDWSYNLLSPAEQILFRRLTTFVGGWTLEAAEFVCADALLKSEDVLHLMEQLINKSVILAEAEHGNTRYRMLETMRQYASEKLLESGERSNLGDRHLEYFLNLAETAAPHLIRPEQIEWLPLLDADYENLRLAFESSLDKETAESSMTFCAALYWYWMVRCYWLEGLRWVTRALEKPGQEATKSEKVARVKALYTQASLQGMLARFEESLSSAESSLTLALDVSEKKDIAIARYFVGAGLIWLSESEYERAVPMIEESLDNFQELNDIFWQAQAFQSFSQIRTLGGQGKRKWDDVPSKLVELARAAGERLTLADALEGWAMFLFDSNQVDAAREYAEESDQLYEQIGAAKASFNSLLFAQIAWISGEYTRARVPYMELQERCRLLGDSYTVAICQINLGMLSIEEGQLAEAQVELEKALALSQTLDYKPVTANCLVELSKLSYMQGKLEAFKRYVRECLALKNYFNEGQKSYILLTILISLSFQNPEIATQLLGVIDYFVKRGEYLGPVTQRHRDSASMNTRTSLGNAAFEDAFADGQKMSLDKALDLALKTVEEM